MVEIRGITLGQLEELYDTSPPEVQKWIRENGNLWFEKELSWSTYSVLANIKINNQQK